MMCARLARLKALARPFRAVELPGGSAVHVRDLTIADLRRVDRLAAAGDPDPGELGVRSMVLMAAAALAGEDGAPLFPDLTAEDVAEVEQLTAAQLRAVVAAAVPSKDDAKNA